ncbi:MAG TPA: PilZ domain-containing protein [Polyangiaceae bacterium]|jgi:type IV pilus assembly protein PilZ
MSDDDPRGAARPTQDSGADRREHDRFEVSWTVDCVADDTFLFASITNISQMGIFVRTIEPLEVGTGVCLTFAPPGYPAFELDGVVAWVNPLREGGDNPNPGMGIRFDGLKLDDRERLVEVIRTIAYVRDPS